MKFLLAVLFNSCCLFAFAQTKYVISEAKAKEIAAKVLEQTPIIDGHSDFYHRFYSCSACPRDLNDFRLDSVNNGSTSIPLYRKGKVGGQLYNVYGKDRNMLNLLQAFDLMHRYATVYPNDFTIVGSSAQMRQTIVQKKIGIVPILEGAVLLQNNFSLLRMYYKLGLRSVTFAYHTNDLADGSDDTARHHGISPLGIEMIKEMNRLGIMIDMSHTSADAMRAVLKTTEAPVIFSHSNAYNLCKVNRNVPDDVLKALKKNKGIIMINFIPFYISQSFSDWLAQAEKSWNAKLQELKDTAATDKYYEEVWKKENPQPVVTVTDIADHFDYVKNLIGVDYIGIGSDLGWDGYEFVTKDMDKVSCFPLLIIELAKRGWTEAELRKIAGENFLRVFEAVEKKAKEIQQRGK